jgi:hypothetical protein
MQTPVKHVRTDNRIAMFPVKQPRPRPKSEPIRISLLDYDPKLRARFILVTKARQGR